MEESSHYELALDRNVSSKSQFPSKTSVISKNSSRLSSCRICLSSILDPASLSCGHKFCERCLEKYWDIRDRPDFIVCPLCRGYAFDVNFSKTEAIPSTVDFRKTFNGLENIDEALEQPIVTPHCIRFSLLMPAVYYAFKWLKTPINDFLTFLHLKFSSRL